MSTDRPSAPLLDHVLPLAGGGERSLAEYAGQPLLVVNTASECGFTPQYAALQGLHEQYADRGLRVLGFPCNQFGGQEPGDEAQIVQFCSTRFAVTFDLFAKVEVKGDGAHPFFRALQEHPRGAKIRWNFYKFLVDRDGDLVDYWVTLTKPSAGRVRRAIERALGS